MTQAEMNVLTSNAIEYPKKDGGAGALGHEPRRLLVAVVSIGALVLLCAAIFYTSIISLWTVWFTSPEYNYAPIVPFISALMILRDLQSSRSRQAGRAGSGWLGVAFVALGLFAGIIGFRTRMDFIGQSGLFLTVIGAIIAIIGEGSARRTWPGLVFLLFALPMANIIQVDLTWALQLAASQGSVAIISFIGIPVYRDGNIIDLGQIQLQVAEACSGLRYLFPLACFSFLSAYFFKGSAVSRLVIFVSALPITLLMNVIRIALTALLVTAFGIAAAQGFFHDFEGWAVFVASMAVMLLEMKVICLLGRGDRGLLRRLDITMPNFQALRTVALRTPVAGFVVIGLSVMALAAEAALSARPVPVLVRSNFADFPVTVAGWNGIDIPLDQDTLTTLDVTDYLSRTYFGGADPSAQVNLFITYYESQRSYTAIHSPLVCIPGGGWEIEQLGDIPFPASLNHLTPEYIKRLVIRRGLDRQLVYYWFEVAGQPSISDYGTRLRVYSDALLHNRTDGGLIRFVTPIGPDGIDAADARLRKFTTSVASLLQGYLP